MILYNAFMIGCVSHLNQSTILVFVIIIASCRHGNGITLVIHDIIAFDDGVTFLIP